MSFVEHAEADAFYCFTNLMIHIRDNFMKIYDHSEFGILVRMQRFLMLLKKTDPPIHALFERQKLKPEFYAFRWLTLLLSQEFRLPDVLRIWDSLFADQERNFEFLLYICCAMIVYVCLLSARIVEMILFLQSSTNTSSQWFRIAKYQTSSSEINRLMKVEVRCLLFRIILKTSMFIKYWKKLSN